MQVRDTPLQINQAGDTVTVAVGAGGSGVYYGPYRDKDTLKAQGTLITPGTSFSISTPVWVVSQGGRDGMPGDVQITSDVSGSSGTSILHNGTLVTNPNFVDVSEADLIAIGVLGKSIVDVKGDLLVATAADTVARLAAGADGTVLTADSTQTGGVRWSAATGGTTLAAADGGDPTSTYGAADFIDGGTP